MPFQGIPTWAARPIQQVKTMDNSLRTRRRSRVLIVDDHPIVRHGLSQLIGRQPDLEVCGEAANATEALRLVETSRPDVAIVDISLNGDNGIQLIEQIRDLYACVKVLVSSMHEEKSFAGRCIRAGALGYVSKREAITKVVEAVRRVQRGEIVFSPDVEKRLIQRSAVGLPLDCNPIETLTDRELQVFEMIGQGLNTQQISRKLGLSPRTVETHRVKIKTKLNLANSAELGRRACLWVCEMALS
jgi:DNA-binding NarL/FixJ family response regulator